MSGNGNPRSSSCYGSCDCCTGCMECRICVRQDSICEAESAQMRERNHFSFLAESDSAADQQPGMGNRIFHVFCSYGTPRNRCSCGKRNRKYFQEPDRMLLSWTGKCRKHHRRKPSRSKPPGRGKRSRRTSDKNCDHRRNPVRSGSDHSVSIYHPNGRPDSDSLWIFTENATDLFLLHSRKISQLHDYWRHLCSRGRLKVWNAV